MLDRAMYETNVFGVLRVLQAVVPGMRERERGTVVNISSMVGVSATMPLNGLYASTKHALEAITETLYYELRHFGVRVVSVHPPWRMPVGEAAEEAVALRRKLDDREWEQLVDERRPFSW